MKTSAPLTPCYFFKLREYWGALGSFFSRYGANLEEVF